MKTTGSYQQDLHTLLCRLPWPTSRDGAVVRSLGVTSCVAGEGVSTLVAQLGAAAALYSEQRVLLIDANPTSPSFYGPEESVPGWAEVLRGELPACEAVRPLAQMNAFLLPGGNWDGALCVDASSLSAAFSDLKQGFSLILVDMPPLTHPQLALPLGLALDGVVLVVQAELLPADLVRRHKELLQSAGICLLGAVLNKQRQYLPRWLTSAS